MISCIFLDCHACTLTEQSSPRFKNSLHCNQLNIKPKVEIQSLPIASEINLSQLVSITKFTHHPRNLIELLYEGLDRTNSTHNPGWNQSQAWHWACWTRCHRNNRNTNHQRDVNILLPYATWASHKATSFGLSSPFSSLLYIAISCEEKRRGREDKEGKEKRKERTLKVYFDLAGL